jgi:hypothetical protein
MHLREKLRARGMRSFRLCLLLCVTAMLVILGKPDFLWGETQPAPQGIMFPQIAANVPFDYGDANGDGVIDAGDAVYLINYLYRSGPAPDPLDAGDASCDMLVDVGDVVWLINYLYKDGEPPPCFSPADDFDPDSLESQSQMLNSSICDTGRTDVAWTTPMVPTYDTYTEMVGDTTVEHSMCVFQADSGSYLRFPLPLQLMLEESEGEDLKQSLGDWSSAAGSYTSTYFPGCHYRPSDGADWQSAGIRVNGNTVTVGNHTFTFDDPSPLNPTLVQMILQKKDHPPPTLTAQQISTACGEGAYSVANCRITSAFYLLQESFWLDSHTHCERQQRYWFLFEHAWVYYCPHGPQRRHYLAIFEGSTFLICNGVVLSHDSFSAVYRQILQTM